MWWNTACSGKQPVQTASTSFHCTPCIGSQQLAQGWGPILEWWSWWQPLLPPSAVLHLTLTLSASGSIVHLLAGPSSLMVSHLDIHQHQGLGPLEVQTWVSKKLAPKGGGGGSWAVAWIIVVISYPAGSTSLTHHCFLGVKLSFMTAVVEANSTDGRAFLAACMLLQDLYKWRLQS